MNRHPAYRALAKRIVLSGLLAIVIAVAPPAQEPTSMTAAMSDAATMAAGQAAAKEAVIATVNGEPITAGERDEMTDQIVYQQLRAFGANIAQLPEDQVRQLRMMAKSQALDHLVNLHLVMQAKEKAGIEIPAEIVEQHKQRQTEMIQERLGMSYEQYLVQTGKTEAQATGELVDQLKIEKLLEARTGELEPTDEQERAYYEQNKEKMTEPAQLRTSHILIKFPGDPQDPAHQPPSDEAKAMLHKQAEEVLAMVKAGGDFAELAKKYSGCPSAPRGGDLDFSKRGAMVDEYDKAAWAMDVNQVGDEVVETVFGYHIIKVTDKKEGGVPAFEQVSQEIHNTMTSQRFQDAMESLLEELRKSAKIELKQSAQAAPAAGMMPPAPIVP
jgi:peptidyl-prolyl cis-trans isomerase C